MEDKEKWKWAFYLAGRDAEPIRIHRELAPAIAEDVVKNGTPVRDAILAAAEREAKPRETAKYRAEFVSGLYADLMDGEGDDSIGEDDAYAAFCKGRIDTMCHRVENDVLAALGKLV